MTLKMYACSACLVRARSGQLADRLTEDPCITLVPAYNGGPHGCLYPDPSRDTPEWREVDLRVLGDMEVAP